MAGLGALGWILRLLLAIGSWSLISGQDLQTIKVTENSSVDIPCDAYSLQTGAAQMQWRFEKDSSIVLLYYDSRFTYPYKDRAQYSPTKIHFTSVTRKDTGKYICEVLWSNGELRKSEVNLIVEGNVILHEEMKVLVASGKAYLIDVRLPEEIANGRIANSVNIPVAEVEEALKMDPETFRTKYSVEKPQKDDENLIFYCQTGKRSAQATETAMMLGYINARNYAGGYKEWSEKEEKLRGKGSPRAGNVISHEEMKVLVGSGKGYLIDVRLPEEVANGRIANSVNIPVAEVEEALKMDPETFKTKYGVEKPQKDDENLIFYCQIGKRSAQATETAMILGYIYARNYAGGYKEWSEKEEKLRGKGSPRAGNVISHEEMKVLVGSGKGYLIDVRLPEEVANGRIANSVNIPVAEVEEALKMDPETFKTKYGVEKPQKDDENLIFYCQIGKRSAQATETAMILGYIYARNYAGGYKEWSEKEEKLRGKGSPRAGNVISHEEMKVLVASGKGYLIDVRLPEEVADGRIANSVNIPVVEVEEALKMDPETFKTKYGVEKPQKDDENLIFYCQTGKRSAQATETAMILGFTNARNYAGGYKEWSEKEEKLRGKGSPRAASVEKQAPKQELH